MDYCFRLVLAAGFVALPISLFAGEKGPAAGIQGKGQSHPQWTTEQKDKFKAALEQLGQHSPEQQAKIEAKLALVRAKMAEWKKNHPNDSPPAGFKTREHRQQTGSGGNSDAGEHHSGKGTGNDSHGFQGNGRSSGGSHAGSGHSGHK